MGPWVVLEGGGGCTFRGVVRALLAPFAHVASSPNMASATGTANVLTSPRRPASR